MSCDVKAGVYRSKSEAHQALLVSDLCEKRPFAGLTILNLRPIYDLLDCAEIGMR